LFAAQTDKSRFAGAASSIQNAPIFEAGTDGSHAAINGITLGPVKLRIPRGRLIPRTRPAQTALGVTPVPLKFQAVVGHGFLLYTKDTTVRPTGRQDCASLAGGEAE
jgi:hypothetical protein